MILVRRDGKETKMEEDEKKWKEICLLDEKISISLPEEWTKMPDEMAEQKFPYLSKPQEMYVNENTDSIITFNLLEKELKEDEVHAAISEIQRMIGHMYPESINKSSTVLRVEAGMAGWFSYVTGSVEQDNVHIMFIMSCNGKMLLGGYHFPDGQQKTGTIFFFQVLKKLLES